MTKRDNKTCSRNKGRLTADKVNRANSPEQEPLDRSGVLKLEGVKKDVSALKSAVDDVIKRRERLPQPLFWSLFHGEISTIKEKKAKNRFLRRVIYGIEL